MNKKIFSLLALIISVSCTAAAAGETVSLPQAVFTGPVQAGPEHAFSMVVHGDGRILTTPGAIFTAGQEAADVQLPYLISTPNPIHYPKWAVKAGWQGDFVIAIEVLKDGSVGRFYVMKSTGHERLDDAAILAIKSWKFQPAMQKGQAVVTCVQLPVRFELKD